MKRSNLYSLVVVGILLICFSIMRFTKRPQPTIYGFSKPVKVLSIESPNLQATDIIVDPAIAPAFPQQKTDTPDHTNHSSNDGVSFFAYTIQGNGNSYLRYHVYKDNKKVENFNPATYVYKDTLHVIHPNTFPNGQREWVELRIDGLQTILLNRKPIWNAPYKDTTCKN